MIYETTGVQQVYYSATDGDEWAHLVEATSKPATLFDHTPEQIQAYKVKQAPYVVYGHSESLQRSDDLLSRNVLFIDVDEYGEYGEHSQQLANSFTGLGLSYVIYPTIRNGIKPGARLRVGIPLDRDANRDEYLKVWRVLTTYYHIQADLAGAERSFKQLQGLYIKTSQNAQNSPILATGGMLQVDAYVQIYDSNPGKYASTTSTTFTIATSGEKQRNAWPERNKRIMAFLMDPDNNWQAFGGWDNALTSAGGWIYKNTNQDIRYTAEAIEQLNDNGSDPIDNKQLGMKFKSWFKTWNK